MKKRKRSKMMKEGSEKRSGYASKRKSERVVCMEPSFRSRSGLKLNSFGSLAYA